MASYFMTILEKVTLSEQERKFMLMPPRLNYSKIDKLDDDEFIQLHLELMTEYKTQDGWWSKNKIPHCISCNLVIPGPEQMVRYHGRTLHPDCFREEWEHEKKEYPRFRKYWDRIARLI